MRRLAHGSLIVSCQARRDNPLHGPAFMAAMARAAEQGGAGGLRANGPADIAAIRAASDLAVIGLHKLWTDGVPVYITPTCAAASAVIDAGADIVALDCTDRPRAGDGWRDILAHIRARGAAGFADVSTLSEGLAAAEAGAAHVATTLAGHTDATAGTALPDLALVAALVGRLAVPVICEGGVATPADLRAAFDAGAHAVVVGTAITNPREITRGFAAACPT